MRTAFVVIAGLPGSGKTTLGRRLAPAMELPLIDKDDILERLFESKGVGDAAWRRSLSRESDVLLQHRAKTSGGAILTSFWHVPGMLADSGTPIDWLAGPSHHVVVVHCVCAPAIAARRFLKRQRHPGHLDDRSSEAEVLASLQRLARLPPLDIGARIDVDTSSEPNLADVVRAVRDAFRSSARSGSGRQRSGRAKT